jgi:hypothetical protein
VALQVQVIPVALPVAAMALLVAAEAFLFAFLIFCKFYKANFNCKKYVKTYLPNSVQVLPVDRSGQVDGGPGLLLKVVHCNIPVLAAS